MGKKKTKTSSNETSHSVTTPNNPEWASAGVQGLASGVQHLGTLDLTSLVAPLSGLEQQAAQGAAGLGPRAGGEDVVGSQAWLDKLIGAPPPTVTAASLLDNLQAYSSPYQAHVVDAASADFDADAGRTRASQDLALAGQGAFGGSGAALTKSLTEGELARTRNSQISKLLQDMFVTSAGLSGQDADRRQQASVANANLAQQHNQSLVQYALDRDANSRANIASQASLGQQLRGVDQESRLAPYTALSKQIDMFSGLPLSLFQGQTTDSTGTRTGTETTSGATLGDIASLVGAVSGFKFPTFKLPGSKTDGTS